MDFDDRILEDGAVVESSIPMREQESPVERYRDFKIYKAQIDAIYYVDDPTNRTGQVEYDLSIMSSNPRQIYRKVSHAVALNSLGGINNWSETVYKETSKVLTNKKAKSDDATPSNKNGDFVAVAFLEGNEERAVILGPWAHSRNKNAAKKEDGKRIKGEYNGVQWEVNKDGEFVITMLGGPKDDNEKLANEGNGGLKFKFAKDGKITIETGDQPIITLDKSGNEITVEANNVKIGDGAVEPIVLGNQWVIYTNAQIVAKLNALIAAFGTLVSTFDSHTHGAGSLLDGGGSPCTGSSGGPSGSGPSGPSAAANAGSAQLATKGKVE